MRRVRTYEGPSFVQRLHMFEKICHPTIDRERGGSLCVWSKADDATRETTY